MKSFVIDPGHKYRLLTLDGKRRQILTFVKRRDKANPSKYPGNKNSYQGTTIQSVIRCLIDRIEYLDNQIPHPNNKAIREMFDRQLWLLEDRAAERHGYAFEFMPQDIHKLRMCRHCGHVVCKKLGNAHRP